MHILSNPRKAKRFYDFISFLYDMINPLLYTKEMRACLLEETEEGLILDVGVGTGYTSHGLHSVGIDISERMLLRGHGMRVLAEGGKPPFRKESFSTVICAGSFYYLEDPVASLRNFYELLKPRGVFLSISPSLRLLSPLFFVYTEKDYADFFEKTGFVLEKVLPMRGIALFVKGRKR